MTSYEKFSHNLTLEVQMSQKFQLFDTLDRFSIKTKKL